MSLCHGPLPVRPSAPTAAARPARPLGTPAGAALRVRPGPARQGDPGAGPLPCGPSGGALWSGGALIPLYPTRTGGPVWRPLPTYPPGRSRGLWTVQRLPRGNGPPTRRFLAGRCICAARKTSRGSDARPAPAAGLRAPERFTGPGPWGHPVLGPARVAGPPESPAPSRSRPGPTRGVTRFPRPGRMRNLPKCRPGVTRSWAPGPPLSQRPGR